MIKTIIFDLGGVLIDWDPVLPYIKVFKGDKDKALWFIKNICNHEWNAQSDAGRRFDELINERILKFPEFTNEITLFQDLWVEMLQGEISGTVKILEELHTTQKYKLLAITNWSAETFPIAKEKYVFLNLFEDIAVSGELEMIKPHPEIFEYMIKKHKLNPANAIFIDDNEQNIIASKKLGLKGILFTNPDELRDQLVKFGISSK